MRKIPRISKQTTTRARRMSLIGTPPTRIPETRKSNDLRSAKDDIIHLVVSRPSLRNAQGKLFRLILPNAG